MLRLCHIRTGTSDARLSWQHLQLSRADRGIPRENFGPCAVADEEYGSERGESCAGDDPADSDVAFDSDRQIVRRHRFLWMFPSCPELHLFQSG